MNVKKIIPCLDIKDGRVVKGIGFTGLRDAGDPVALARAYCEQGADELVLLDITATNENRDTVLDLVTRVAAVCTIPLVVGGGIRSLSDMERILYAGAAKVSVNSAAVADKTLIARAADAFGSGRIILAIDAVRAEDGWYEVLTQGGGCRTGLNAVAWAREAEALGAGEILLTSKDADGQQAGYDLAMTRAVADAVGIPVTASGGCGRLEDFAAAFEQGGASGALAASLFHFGALTVPQVKEYLRGRGIAVR